MFNIVLAAEPFNDATLTNLEKNIGGFHFAGSSVSALINNSIGPVALIFYAIGFFMVLNIVSAGISLMTSAGDPAKVKAAQAKITNSLLGLGLAFIAYWVVQLAGSILGLTGLNGTF